MAEARILARSERAMAIGLVPGALFGLAIGALFGDLVAPSYDLAIVVAVCAVLGAALGLLVGSFYGLTPTE